MAEERAGVESTEEQNDAPAGVLLFVIVSDPSMLDRLMTLLLDIGLAGATVIESKGMAAIIREEMPIFSGLGALLPERTGSRIVFSATTAKHAQELFEVLVIEFGQRQCPIAFTVPLASSLGLRS